ncbi:MAG: RsmE family RNA methyltransferase, partial [Candidatus Acidiferrales bacterium]
GRAPPHFTLSSLWLTRFLSRGSLPCSSVFNSQGTIVLMRRRFFVDHFDDGTATLRGDAAEHLGRVLRAEAGQLYELSDGERVWLGRVERVGLLKRGEYRVEFSLVEPIAVQEPALRLQLLIALVKFDRFEWCLEKATELGVSEIIPLIASRTDKVLVGAAGKRHARWQRILLESAQQSRRLRPPKLAQAATVEDAYAGCGAECKLLLSERSDAPGIHDVLLNVNARSAAISIGPEGGWTDGELGLARAAGFKQASLGQLVLRTETAVLASLAILHFALDG